MDAAPRDRADDCCGDGDLQVWTLLAGDFPDTLASTIELEAFDGCHQRMI